MKPNKYIISNMHGTIIYEGDHYSAYDAWMEMFRMTNTPRNEWVISKAIDRGMECNRE
jgi:hypothetical protein